MLPPSKLPTIAIEWNPTEMFGWEAIAHIPKIVRSDMSEYADEAYTSGLTSILQPSEITSERTMPSP